MLQHNLVFHDTVANNIGCGDPAYTLPQIIEAAKTAHAHHFIQKLPQGYETPIGEMGHPLSVSEQFRIALARAILRDPALLIIEEPEKTLDEDSKNLLDDTLARVLPGRTVIFLPHRISTIRSCDVLFMLHKGRVDGVRRPQGAAGAESAVSAPALSGIQRDGRTGVTTVGAAPFSGDPKGSAWRNALPFGSPLNGGRPFHTMQTRRISIPIRREAPDE